jgi:hypothetical protein
VPARRIDRAVARKTLGTKHSALGTRKSYPIPSAISTSACRTSGSRSSR